MEEIIKKDITLVRGNTKVLDIKIKNLQQDVVIDKIYFTVKKCVNDKEAVLQKYLGNGIELIEETEEYKLYRLTINADDTENMYLTTVYGYDIKIIIDNVKITKVVGNFQLLKNYTKKENEV